MLPTYIFGLIVVIFGSIVRKKIARRQIDVEDMQEYSRQRLEAVKSGQIIILELRTDLLGNLLILSAVIGSMFDADGTHRNIEFSLLIVGAVLFLIGTFLYVYVEGDDIRTFRKEYKVSEVTKVTGDWIIKVETTSGTFHLCFLHRQFSLDMFRERAGDEKWFVW